VVPQGVAAIEGVKMVAELILEFDGVTAAQYHAVNEELGIDPESGEGDWPKGLLIHAAGLNAQGQLVVTEVWDSVEQQEEFMHGRLGEALGKSGIADPPSSVTWIELIAHRVIS
jgi:hypothetical protein